MVSTQKNVLRSGGGRNVDPPQAVALVRPPATTPPVPYLDHRIDEILELLKKFVELEYTYHPVAWDWYGVEIQPNSDLKLLEIHGEGLLESIVIVVKMPDETPPDVGPYIVMRDYEGKEHIFEEWTIYELWVLGLTQPTVEGYVTKYDDINYIYKAHWLPRIPFTEASISIRNWTHRRVWVEIVGVRCRVRPYVRYWKRE